MSQLKPDRSKIVLDEIREIVDPDNRMTNYQLVGRIEKVFGSYQKSLESARKRVKRHRAKKKAEQESLDVMNE